MVLGGQCSSCGRFSPALVGCKACGAKVCHMCIDVNTGFCRLCKGIKRI